MIKVCHMTSAHGVEDVRIFYKECISLAQAGYEVYLVERGESYNKNGVYIVGVGEMPVGRLKRMTEGARRVYEAALALDKDVTNYYTATGYDTSADITDDIIKAKKPDGFERSLLLTLADVVRIAIKGGIVDMTVEKKF